MAHDTSYNFSLLESPKNQDTMGKVQPFSPSILEFDESYGIKMKTYQDITWIIFRHRVRHFKFE